MDKIKSIKTYMPIILVFVLTFQISCIFTYTHNDEVAEEFRDESYHDLKKEKPITMNIKFEFKSNLYKLLDVVILEETFARGSHIKINGPYGVRGISHNGEELFHYVNYTKPINGWVSLPFSEYLAGIELYRNKGSKPTISYFSREQLIELADYIPQTE